MRNALFRLTCALALALTATAATAAISDLDGDGIPTQHEMAMRSFGYSAATPAAGPTAWDFYCNHRVELLKQYPDVTLSDGDIDDMVAECNALTYSPESSKRAWVLSYFNE